MFDDETSYIAAVYDAASSKLLVLEVANQPLIDWSRELRASNFQHRTCLGAGCWVLVGFEFHWLGTNWDIP